MEMLRMLADSADPKSSGGCGCSSNASWRPVLLKARVEVQVQVLRPPRRRLPVILVLLLVPRRWPAITCDGAAPQLPPSRARRRRERRKRAQAAGSAAGGQASLRPASRAVAAPWEACAATPACAPARFLSSLRFLSSRRHQPAGSLRLRLLRLISRGWTNGLGSAQPTF